MGSHGLAGVTFRAFSNDHLPRHVHGSYAGIEVIVEIWPEGAKQADRKDAVTPANAKRSDVAYVLRVAVSQIAALNKLWEDTHES